MIIQHNLSAINSNRQLNIVNNSLCKATEQLSSGYRINRASDDAAGLSISEKMRKQIRGLSQGVANTEDGISLCQVADGALNEVHDMLQRINELAIKAANGTNSDTDRVAIQNEVDAIIAEIDRIGETTKFNDLYIFRGLGKQTWVRPGTEAATTIPTPGFSEVSFDCELQDGPISSTSGRLLKLNAKASTGTYQANWPLVFGNGSTSNSSIFGSYTGNDNQTHTFTTTISNLTTSQPTSWESGTDKLWSRTFSVTTPEGLNLSIVQTVALHAKTDTSQYYSISYEVKNNGTNDVTYSFIQHEDTAYNNNDRVESYHYLKNSTRTPVDKYGLYTTSNAYTGSNVTNSLPDNFSIVNTAEALPFTENVKNYNADTLVIGHYNQIYKADLYKDSSINNVLGSNAAGTDLGFTLVWTNKTLAAGANLKMKFDQGIMKTENDPNVPAGTKPAPYITINTGNIPVIETAFPDRQIWLQTGAECMEGMVLKLGAISSEVLGLDRASVLSENDADCAINEVSGALKYVSALRSRIGAYQNRLEHTVLNENNIIENTQAAESQIRDTDMATQMVTYSNLSVLRQAGISMLTQSNQSNQGVLALIA